LKLINFTHLIWNSGGITLLDQSHLDHGIVYNYIQVFGSGQHMCKTKHNYTKVQYVVHVIMWVYVWVLSIAPASLRAGVTTTCLQQASSRSIREVLREDAFLSVRSLDSHQPSWVLKGEKVARVKQWCHTLYSIKS